MDGKTKIMVSQIDSAEFFLVNNEVEALLLENNLVKKIKPKYNIDLKDSRRYAYVEITHEEFPRIILARKIEGEGEYFGPFTSAKERNEIIDFLNRTFRLRTCKKLLKKPCLKKHIGFCEAPCTGSISKESYGERIRRAREVLKGDIGGLVKTMKKEMGGYSERQEYEKAKEIKEQMEALRILEEKQAMERQKKYDEDVLNFIIQNETVYLVLFNVSKGILHNKQEFEFDYYEGWFEDFIMQYYSENPIPLEIIIPKEMDGLGILKVFLNERNPKADFVIPKKGEKRELLELAMKNIELSFFKNEKKALALKESLMLEKTPEVIECFDISHLFGTLAVGSMVQFRKGEPDKSNYRRFKIRSIEGIDDYGAISEIVGRRYARLKEEGKEYPDLIVVDGGRGQLNSARKELEKLGIYIEAISIAKKFEEIYVQNSPKPVILDKKDMGLKYLQEIRDEAHRFAIKYHHLLRKKKIRES